jgi:hypothetical protein
MAGDEESNDVMMTESASPGYDREERLKARRGRKLIETLVRSHREIMFTHKARMFWNHFAPMRMAMCTVLQAFISCKARQL